MNKTIIATHTRPDLDSMLGVYLFQKANPGKVSSEKIFLEGGDQFTENGICNIVFIDRGRGKYDHHGKHGSLTSAEKVAEDFNLSDQSTVKKLLRLNKNNDLRGITQPFDVGDVIKKMAHNSNLSDKERMNKGLRILDDIFQFRELGMERDVEFTRRVISKFMEEKKEVLFRMLKKYCNQLKKESFTRDCDLVEVLTSEKNFYGEEKATLFAFDLLEIISQDEINFNKALKEFEKAKKVRISKKDLLVKNPEKIGFFDGDLIVVARSNNPVFNKAARTKGSSVTIQKSNIGTHLFFDFTKVKNSWIDNIMAAIRLEEQILQGRRRIIANFFKLKKEGRIKGIKEWYYYVSNDQKGGRFILNKSFTAPDPEIPDTKITPEELAKIVKSVLRRRDAFYFKRYASIRLREK